MLTEDERAELLSILPHDVEGLVLVAGIGGHNPYFADAGLWREFWRRVEVSGARVRTEG